MVVTCENCNTGFNLDENLIKKSGSKVRCSKCRHIFTAYKPVPVEEPEPATEVEVPPEEALDFDLSEEPQEKTEDDEIALEDLGLEEEIPDRTLRKRSGHVVRQHTTEDASQYYRKHQQSCRSAAGVLPANLHLHSDVSPGPHVNQARP